MAFVHLHNHTTFSLLDGSTKIDEMVKKVKEMGMDSVAITDHGAMFGVIDFYKAAKEEGIKPIIGCEVYVAPGSMLDKQGSNEESKYHHLVLLCENNIGYKNLCNIVSIGWLDGFYSKPRVDMDVLRKHSEGLICSSACLGGSIPQALLHNSYEKAKEKALELQEVFGKDNFFIEIQDHGIPEQTETNPFLIKLSKEIGAGLIATNDAHYLNKEDHEAHEILLCVQTKSTINQENRFKFLTSEFYVKTEEEMRSLFPEVPEAFDNTQKIADRCNVDFKFGVIHLPVYEIPSEYKDNIEYFSYLCKTGMKKRYGEDCPQEYYDRLDYELSIINGMGFTDYYLIVWDFINFAKNNSIPVGPGRGSGAGSIAAYAIEITDIDPMKYGLLFERFLNPERISMPDFDIDFCYERRHEVIEYVSAKYGSERVSQIITFGTMGAKNAVRDVGRAYELPVSEINRIAKMIPNDAKMTISKALENGEFKKEYEENPQSKKIIDMALKLEGIQRHTSKHAAGVLISDKPIVEYAPLSTAEDKETKERVPVIQFPMGTLEEIGLVKMDFLGLRTLTVIEDTAKLVREKYDPNFFIQNVQMDDEPEVYQMLAEESTIGVFQLESEGMKSLINQMYFNVSNEIKKINKKYEKTSPEYEKARKELGHALFERLIAAISLYRPGPMDYIPQYIEGMKKPESIKYDCPEVKPILAKTYGVIVYQEQVQEICRELAGYSYGRADLIRRAMSKKKKAIMDKEQQIFFYGNQSEIDEAKEKGKDISEIKYVAGCVNNGISIQAAKSIWEKMEKFAEYAFNKSHAACYATIAYQTAFLKKHYQIDFMACTATSYIGNKDKLPYYCNSIQKSMKIPVLPPDVNISQLGFTPYNDQIRFGLKAIKKVGSNITQEIIDERKNGEYVSLHNFCHRLSGKGLNKGAIESLIKAGAFDSMEYNRRTLLSNAANIAKVADDEAKRKASGQISLFEFLGDDAVKYTEAKVEVLEEYPERVLLDMEREVTGMFISGHPLNKYSKAIEVSKCTSINDIRQSVEDGNGKYAADDSVLLPLILIDVDRKITRSGAPMLIITAQDLDNETKVLVFNNVIEYSQDLLVEGSCLMMKCRLDIKEDSEIPEIIFICESVIEMPDDSESEETIKEFSGKASKNAKPTYRKPKAKIEPIGEPEDVKKKETSKFNKGLYIQIPNKDNMQEFIRTLKTYPGTTNVFIYVIEEEKIYKSNNIKINVEDKTLIKTLFSKAGTGNIKLI